MDLNKTVQYLLFPGIIIHEFSHAFACVCLGIKIKKIKWVSAEGGFVIHEASRSHATIIISLFPFVFNLLFAFSMGLLLKISNNQLLSIILIWLGISAIFFSVPSVQDAKNVFAAIKESYTKKQSIWKWLYKIILLPLTVIVLVLSWIFKMLDESFIFRLILIVVWLSVFIV